MTVNCQRVAKYSRAVSPAELYAALRTIVPGMPEGVEADIIPFDESGQVVPNLSGPRLDLRSCGLMLKWSVTEDAE